MNVSVVDCGHGNLRSVERALRSCGAKKITVTSEIADVTDADRLILPGVGAFKDSMSSLQEADLQHAIIEYASSGRPLLGICLGMQMLATYSHEFGVHEGLNLIPGTIERIPSSEAASSSERKVPFVSWNTLMFPNADLKQTSVLRDITAKDAVYLTHSYRFIPSSDSNILAHSDYEGIEVVTAVQANNITGLQFHPEKSGQVGLRILENFLAE